jgi:DNA-binding CsgD family transcriptional regulator
MPETNGAIYGSADVHSADLVPLLSPNPSSPGIRSTLNRLYIVTAADPVVVFHVVFRLASLDKLPKRLCVTHGAAGTSRIELDTLSVRPQILDLISTELRELPGVLTVQRFNVPSGAERGTRRSAYPDSLTDRERQVLWELSQGKSNKLIARDLALSAPTVSYHMQRAFRKLGVRKRALAVAEARRRGWFT